MRQGIHPPYQPVVFEDATTGGRWLCRSSITTDRETTWTDGKVYPHVVAEVTNLSHPFFTGQMRIVDTAGRVERFHQRYGERTAPGTDTPPQPTRGRSGRRPRRG